MSLPVHPSIEGHVEVGADTPAPEDTNEHSRTGDGVKLAWGFTGVTSRRWKFRLVMMSKAQSDAYRAFRDTVHGTRDVFVFTDWLGVTANVRFAVEPHIYRQTELAPELYAADVELEEALGTYS
jgi:hypothetical protein